MSEAGAGGYWVVIQFKHGQLDRARRELRRQGFELFCPMIHKSGSTTALVPMLKTYAFLRVAEGTDPIRNIAMTHGVHAVLGPRPHSPTRVSNGLVAAIRSRCDAADVFKFGSGTTGDLADFLSGTKDMGEEERGYLLLRHL